MRERERERACIFQPGPAKIGGSLIRRTVQVPPPDLGEGVEMGHSIGIHPYSQNPPIAAWEVIGVAIKAESPLPRGWNPGGGCPVVVPHGASAKRV